MSKTSLYSTFTSVDKASWIAQIQTELKDIDIDSFKIKMDDHWEVSPFMHAHDIEKTTSIGGQKEQLKWKILEQFDYSAEDHELIMLALKGGCESLMFQLGQVPELPFEKVLKGVFPEMVEFHFESKKMEPLKSNVEHFSRWLVGQEMNLKEIQGSFRIENPHQHLISVEAIIDHNSFVNSIFPKMNSVCWNIQLPAEKDGLTQPLIGFFKGIVEYLQNIRSLDALQSILKRSVLKVEIGPNYLMEITRLRALRILWKNILLANGINNEEANIEAHFASNHYQEEAEKNMIIASTMAMSALVGGADSVCILPADGNPRSRDIHKRRIARNIHHLLRSEAHLEKHVDPVQGAYFFEYVAQRIVEEVWAKII